MREKFVSLFLLFVFLLTTSSPAWAMRGQGTWVCEAWCGIFRENGGFIGKLMWTTLQGSSAAGSRTLEQLETACHDVFGIDARLYVNVSDDRKTAVYATVRNACTFDRYDMPGGMSTTPYVERQISSGSNRSAQ
jgi:hypothetical protein